MDDTRGVFVSGLVFVAVIATTLLTVPVGSPAAGATPRHPHQRGTRTQGPAAGAGALDARTAGARPTSTGSAPGYAGYDGVAPTSAVTVSASFVVPTISCPAADYLGTIPGVIVGRSDAFLGVGIALECFAGSAVYDPVVFFNGPFTHLKLTINPGDTVVVKVAVGATAIGTVADKTTGVTQKRSFTGFAAGYVDVGDDSEYDYYSQLGVPDFGIAHFASVTVNGNPLSSISPSGYDMGNGATTLIETGTLNSHGNAFTTTFVRNQEPTIAQGRVVEGVAGRLTLSATVWPATFTSSVSTSPNDFSAHIEWGDGTNSPADAIISVAAWNCTYGPIPPAGHCFAVKGRHRYTNAGTYITNVTVSAVGGAASADGIAEIVKATPTAAATTSVGVLTWTTANGSIQMCTATAVSGLDMVMTAKHCFDNLAKDSDFQFAPMHSGNCGSGSSIMSVVQCEGSGNGQDPLGYWHGSEVLPASDTPPASGGDTTFIVLDSDTSSHGYSLVDIVGGLPIHFLAPHGQWSFSAYGYPGRVGNWTLQGCTNETDKSGPSFTVVGIAPCDFGYSDGMAGGTSGGPFVSSNLLPNAVAATQWFICKAPTGGCQIGSTLVWPQPVSENTSVGNYMSNNAMQVFIVAALATFGF
jgi:hypothetical protein